MRVAITGTGLLCAAGLGAQAAFEAMLAGEPGLGGPIADFDPGPYLGARGIRHFDRTALLLACATTGAIDASKLLEGDYAPEEIGIVIGETHGSVQSITEFDQEALREGPRYVNPQAFCNTVINAPAGRLAIRFGITGVNSTISTGSASALDAVGHALALLQTGQIRAAICGAALGYSSEIELGYRRAGILSDAAQAEAPFGAKRRGSVMGEGAAVLVLEDPEFARRRGVPSLARISGSASAFQPSGSDRSGGSGYATALRSAVAQAGITAGDLSLVLSGASGARAGDASEARALRSLLADATARVAVSAPKSVTRECFEASGAIAMVSAVAAIQAGRVPPIAGLSDVDVEAAELDLVIGAARDRRLEHVLVGAREEAGHCAAVVVSRP